MYQQVQVFIRWVFVISIWGKQMSPRIGIVYDAHLSLATLKAIRKKTTAPVMVPQMKVKMYVQATGI